MPDPIYKKLLVLVCLLGLVPALASAEISKVSFTTDPQSVKPGDISGTLTVQLQDAQGNSSPATETMDVEFLSASVTGEFLSPTSGSAATKTISTGSANKNFRYRDSAEGTFSITVKAKGRVSGVTWSVSQNIVVSNSSSGSVSTSTSTTAQTSTNNISSSGGSSSSAASVHYSASAVSTKKLEPTLSLSAGRDRLGSVGSPMEFKAEAGFDYTRNGHFTWNFGDGSTQDGEVLSHTYEYAGEYVVVLNAVFPEGNGVSRVNVKIIDPQISIVSATSERIEVKNNSAHEVSLYGRGMWEENKVFLFPKDTIVKSGQVITFASKTTELQPYSVNNVQLMVIGQIEQSKIKEKLESIKQERITYLQTQIETLQSQLASMPRENYVKVEITTVAPLVSIPILSETATQTAAVIQSLPQPNRSGWVATFKNFLMRRQ